MLRRSMIAMLAPLFGATMLPAQQESKTASPKIVFVCEHGAAKSVIAAKELEKLARERGISIQAVSRGKTPSAEIPLLVRAGLKADGIDIGAMKPVQVKAEDLRDAARVISFGPDLSAVTGQKRTVERDHPGSIPQIL